MPENFFDVERAMSARLIEAVKIRSAAEAELASVFQAAAEKAEREVNRARKANSAARQNEIRRDRSNSQRSGSRDWSEVRCHAYRNNPHARREPRAED